MRAGRFVLLGPNSEYATSFDTWEQARVVFPLEDGSYLLDQETQFEWLTTCDVATAEHLYETYVKHPHLRLVK